MRIGPLTKADVDSVFVRLSDDSCSEIVLCNKTVSEVKDHFYKLVGAPFAATLFADRSVLPLALIALESTGLKVWCGQIIAAEGCWELIGQALTLFLARFTDDFVKRSDGTIEAYSPDGDGHISEWYNTLGFVQDGTNNNGLFRYVRR